MGKLWHNLYFKEKYIDVNILVSHNFAGFHTSAAYRYGFPYRYYRDIFQPSRYFPTIYRHLQGQSDLANFEPYLSVFRHMVDVPIRQTAVPVHMGVVVCFTSCFGVQINLLEPVHSFLPPPPPFSLTIL